jgi:hypothetical protein
MATLGKLAFGWALSCAVIFGPYLVLRFGAPWIVETYLSQGQIDLTDAVYNFIVALNRHYWWVFALYIVLAGLITPSYDRENMGLFGTFVDNPFSFHDDYNRAMFTLMILLAPGKIVWVTAHTTFVEIRDHLSWKSVG